MYSLSSHCTLNLHDLLLLLSLFRSLLRSNEVQRDPRQYEQVVQKVIAYMTLGVDVSGLFSEMIMVSRTERGCVPSSSTPSSSAIFAFQLLITSHKQFGGGLGVELLAVLAFSLRV